MKIFVHEQSNVICKHCDQHTFYPVARFYCSAACHDRDHNPWRGWWLKLTEASMSASKVGAAFIAAASLVAWAGSSRAEPPPPMWVGAFDVPVVTCDTREQAVAIAKAGQESTEAMLAKYEQLTTTINDKGHPSCANRRISSLVINEREDLGLAHSGNGDLLHIWVVHGAASRGEFWFIYAQSDPQTIA